MSRDSRTMTRFNGINAIDSDANVPPDYAIDCRNVIGMSSGDLWAARLTQILIDFSAKPASNLARILALGVLDTHADNGLPPRVVMQQGPNLVLSDAPGYTDTQNATLVVAPLQPGRADFRQCANVMYFSSGLWGGKLLPGDLQYRLWGIVQPVNPPTQVVASTAIAGSITAQRTAGVTTITFPASPGVAGGDPIYVDPLLGDGSFAGLFSVFSASGDTVVYNQPGLPDVGPVTRASYPSPIDPLPEVGYQYRCSFGCSATGHWGTASFPTATILPNGTVALLSPLPPADPQIDQIAWFRNLDDGGDWYLLPNGITPLPLGGPFPRQVVLLDTTNDDLLEDQAQTPPYDNGVSPNGKYLAVSLDRLIMCGILGAEDQIAYTGVESINFGRPQESWCFNNRITVGQGQANPIGIGNSRYGTVIFCTNKTMYILNGTLNDITVTAPTPLSFSLRELPFKVGCYSHFSIQSTPAGVIFLDDGLNLQIFDGYNPPGPLAPVLNDLIGRMTPGSQDLLTSTYVNYLDRQLYVLSFPIDGSLTNNFTVIVDMTQDNSRNTGAWVFDYAIDALETVLNPDGTRIIICAQNQTESTLASSTAGFLTSLPYVQFAPGDPLLPSASYRTGYFGIKDKDGVDEWSYYKLWRFVRLMCEAGMEITAFLVDGDQYSFDQPYVQRFTADSGVYSVNVKARACSLLFHFPDNGSGDPLHGYTINWTFTGKR